MPTKLERAFKELLEEEVREALVFDDASFQRFVDWMEKNLDPNDVFTEDQLEKWATENGFVKE